MAIDYVACQPKPWLSGYYNGKAHRWTGNKFHTITCVTLAVPDSSSIHEPFIRSDSEDWQVLYSASRTQLVSLMCADVIGKALITRVEFGESPTGTGNLTH